MVENESGEIYKTEDWIELHSKGNLSRGELIKKLRVELLEMTLTDFARLCKVSEDNIVLIERNELALREDIIEKVLSPFGMRMVVQHKPMLLLRT